MTDIGLKRYRLIFYGNLMLEADPDAARAAFAKRYKLNDQKLTASFSGRKVALHSELNEQDAYRIQSELEDIGLITHLELLETSKSPQAAPTKKKTAIPPLEKRADPTRANTVQEPAQTSAPKADSRHLTPCPSCRQPIEPKALNCRYCGERVGKRSLTWLWLSAAGLLLAVGIGGLLSFIAPLYQQQVSKSSTTRAISNGIEEAKAIQQPVREFIGRTGFWPNTNLDAGLDEPQTFRTESTDSLTVGNKALIILTFNTDLPDIGGETLLFVPQKEPDGSVSWRCDGGSLAMELRPTECIPPDVSAYKKPEKAKPLDVTSLPSLPRQNTQGPSVSRVHQVIRDEIANTAHVRQALMAGLMEGDWPFNNGNAGLPDGRKIASANFRRVEVQMGGKIMYEFSDAIYGFEGHKLYLVPASIGEWRCEATFPEKYVPPDCGGGVR